MYIYLSVLLLHIFADTFTLVLIYICLFARVHAYSPRNMNNAVLCVLVPRPDPLHLFLVRCCRRSSR